MLRLICCASVLVLACGRTAPPSGNGGDRGGPGSAAAVVASARPDATPPPPVDAAATAAAADPAADPPRGRGDRCSADADCGWDDPCNATRCLGVAQPQAAACDKSRPAPGTCTCVERQCTLRPLTPTAGASAAGCATDDECAVDVGAAGCTLRGPTAIGPIKQQGPVCTCDPATTRCQWSFVGPIACETWRDCSWLRTPRLRPAPSTLVPRPFPRPVKACQDGAVDSVCTPAKVCEVVGWSC